MKFKKLLLGAATVAAVAGLTTFFGLGHQPAVHAADKTVRVGLTGSNETPVWKNVASRLKKQGINLKIVTFSDYNQPNKALANGDLDLNAFQTQIFLDNYNKENHTHLVSIGNTIVSPLGIYSKKVKSVKDIKKGATIAIPNDATNEGRALLLLQSAGLIKVKNNSSNTPSPSDITTNKKNLKIKTLDASQTARSLKSVDASVINGGVAADAGLNPSKDALVREKLNNKIKPYVNVIATQKSKRNDPTFKKVVKAYQTETTKKVINQTSKGAELPAWNRFGKK